MEFYGFLPNQSKMSNIVKWLVAAAAVYMAILGVMQKLWAFIILALIVIGVAFHRKEHVINPMGVDIRDVFIVYRRRHLWRWREVRHVHIVENPDAPRTKVIFSSVDGKTRQFLMKTEEIDDIINLIYSSDPSTRITKGTDPFAKQKKKAPEPPAAKRPEYKRPDISKANIVRPDHKLKNKH